MYSRLLLHFLDLLRHQRMSTEEIQRWQVRSFRRVFEHAREHSPFYRALYRENSVENLRIQQLSDIHALPTISKGDLRRHHASEIVTRDLADPEITVHSTSGSSGEPFKVYFTRTEDYTSHIRVLWMLLQEGYNPRKKITMVTRYEERDRFEVERDVALLAWLQRRLRLFRREIISIYEDPAEVLRRLAAQPPDILWSTPSMMDIVANRAREASVNLGLPVLFLTSETISSSLCALIKKYIARRVVNLYGMMESPSIAVGFDLPESIEVFTPSVLVEYGQPRQDGDSLVAEVIITNLVNLTMPIIRYRTGDIVHIDDPNERFPTRRIGTVVGRTDDIVTLPSGRKVAHHQAHEMFLAFHECEQWQLCQSRNGGVSLRLRIAADAEPTRASEKALQIWARRYPRDPIEVVFVDEIRIDPRTGKLKNILVER
jgi:phenylacetate-CoA ligase